MRIKLMKRNHALAHLRARYWEFVFNSMWTFDACPPLEDSMVDVHLCNQI